ncbi:MAG: AMP-binding protein [Sphingorhabdus sp.]
MNVREVLSNHPFDDRIPVRLFQRLARTDRDLIIEAKTGKRFSYAELGARADALSERLEELGVKPGDRVAWSAPTGPDAVIIWMAVAQLGAIDVGVGDVLKGPLLDHVLNDSAPSALVIDPTMDAGLASLTAERRADFPGVIYTRQPSAALGANEVVLDLTGALPDKAAVKHFDVPIDVRTPATIIYTSGTTGPSKGVLICHHQQFFTGATYTEYFRIDEGSVLYHYSPFNHVSGRQLVVAAMITGSLLVMQERFSISRFWKDINTHKVTHSITLGSAVPLLLSSRDPAARNEGSLRYVWASPALPQLYAEFAANFDLKVISPYGSTETGTVVQPGIIPDEPGPPGNSGRRPEYFELEVVDDNDQICPPGVIGEIVVRPRLPWTTFVGYLGRDNATAQTVRNYWYHTGDLARIDEDGWMFFVDRKQDFMRVKGENVSSTELEQILLMHQDVTDCAIVPVKGELADNEILAIVVAGSGADAFALESFFEWCASQVPHYMVPRYVRLLDDMPRGHSGKIEKHKLKTEGVTRATWDSSAAGLRATRRGVQRASAVTAE